MLTSAKLPILDSRTFLIHVTFPQVLIIFTITYVEIVVKT